MSWAARGAAPLRRWPAAPRKRGSRTRRLTTLVRDTLGPALGPAPPVCPAAAQRCAARHCPGGWLSTARAAPPPAPAAGILQASRAASSAASAGSLAPSSAASGELPGGDNGGLPVRTQPAAALCHRWEPHLRQMCQCAPACVPQAPAHGAAPCRPSSRPVLLLLQAAPLPDTLQMRPEVLHEVQLGSLICVGSMGRCYRATWQGARVACKVRGGRHREGGACSALPLLPAAAAVAAGCCCRASVPAPFVRLAHARPTLHPPPPSLLSASPPGAARSSTASRGTASPAALRTAARPPRRRRCSRRCWPAP